MSTPATPLAELESKIGLWLNPLHIMLLVLLTFSLLGGVYLYEDRRAEVADANAKAQAQVVTALKEAAITSAAQNAALQLKTDATLEAMKLANQQLVTANNQLQSSNTQLILKLTAQQKTDATLPPSGQAQRWEGLVPTAKVSVTPTGFAVDAVGGLATLQSLEEIPVDRQRIANLGEALSNDEKQILNDAVSLKAEQAAHQSDVANDKKQLAESQGETKKVNDDFTAYKHKARRNYIRAFFAGVVVGLVGGHAAGI